MSRTEENLLPKKSRYAGQRHDHGHKDAGANEVRHIILAHLPPGSGFCEIVHGNEVHHNFGELPASLQRLLKEIKSIPGVVRASVDEHHTTVVRRAGAPERPIIRQVNGLVDGAVNSQLLID